jgi:hypothetical protein
MKRILTEIAHIVAILPPHIVMVAAVLALTAWGSV